MRLILAALALSLIGASPSIAFDAAQLQQLLTTNSCSGCDLSGAELSNMSFRYEDLSRANLSRANLTGAYVVGVPLGGTLICRTTWVDGTIRNDSC